MGDLHYFFLFLTTVLLLACSTFSPEEPAALHQTYCGTCHQAPAPDRLPKAIWEKKVLPEMGARLGITTPGYNPYQQNLFEERYHIDQLGVYPDQAAISPARWEQLCRYILRQAPDSLPKIPGPWPRGVEMSQFQSQPLAVDNKNIPVITYLGFQPGSSALWIGDVRGQLYQWSPVSGIQSLQSVRTPIMDLTVRQGQSYITEVGKMTPTQTRYGQVTRYTESGRKLLATELHRPVYTLVQDLNGDGTDELVVCEYGNYTGSMNLFRQAADGYQNVPLFTQAGVIRVIPADMNGDGKEDLVLLCAQGDEGVHILYQGDDLQFSQRDRVLRFDPVWGSSWFELKDYEGDGDLDLILVNGDNADYSIVPKPYHGLRMYLNDGKNQFVEAFFYPLYGATRVIAQDFDQDGDLDFAVAAFFPDFENSPEEAFVYLENQDAAQFRFRSQTTAAAEQGRWMTMTSGDYDQDGDVDLMLGSFIFSPSQTPAAFLKQWEANEMDILVLTNQLF